MTPGRSGGPGRTLKRHRLVVVVGGLLMLLLAAGAVWRTTHTLQTQGDEGPKPRTSPSTSTSVNGDRTRCLTGDRPLDALSEDGQDLFLSLVASAENSTLRWEQQAGYIEENVEGNAAENRGYTGGIVGFTSKTHDMLSLVRAYDAAVPNNPLSGYVDALAKADGTSSTDGLGSGFVRAWKAAARDERFLRAQVDLARKLYLQPAVDLAKQDRLGALGQFAYVDAAIMHGTDAQAGLAKIRQTAARSAKPPAQGGDERAYLDAFLDARVAQMKREKGHRDTSRVDTAQRSFLTSGNLDLKLPLEWQTYGDTYRIYGTEECTRRGISS